MNWKQLYTSASPEERLELLTHMLRVLETRPQRIFTGVGWVQNRRQGDRAHYLNDRRGSRRTMKRIASLLTFIAVLVTVSVATWGFVLHAPPSLGAPVLFFHVTALLGVLAFKPYALRVQPA